MTKAKIHYHDIGDYLSREEKLAIVKKLGSIADTPWVELNPNEHGDWINYRKDSFGEFIPLAPEKKFDLRAQSFFNTYAVGVNTARDAWVYNFSKKAVENNMQRMIAFYNKQLVSFVENKKTNLQMNLEEFIDTNETNISWSVNLKKDLESGISHSYAKNVLKVVSYRPYMNQFLYFDKPFIERPSLFNKLLPAKLDNLFIVITGASASKDFSVLITNTIASFDYLEKTQCFPLYWYEEIKQEQNKQMNMFDTAFEPVSGYYARREAISDFVLTQARKNYGSKTTKEDIFYYVYGFLHNSDYREEFAADLKKMLPRIPFVGDSTVFWKYVKAGHELASLHLTYEDHAHEATGVTVEINNSVYDNFSVNKMRFVSKNDKSQIIYNPYITLTGIPAEAYEYIVNGKSAVEWIMERYQITTHKESGIVNDPNDWATEHNKPRYILDLLLSVIAISVKTVEIVKGLPMVEF